MATEKPKPMQFLPARPPPTERRMANQGIGAAILAARQGKNLKQVELAQKVGIPASTLSAIETGARGARPGQLADIARVLGVEVDALLGTNVGASERQVISKLAALDTSQGRLEPTSKALRELAYLDGLVRFLDHHAERLKVKRREADYLQKCSFDVPEIVHFDDAFFEELLRFWRGQLERMDSESWKSATKR